MKRHGFTLIELVMVIVIIGILAAIAIPRFVSLREDAVKAACQANVGALRAAISNFYAQQTLAANGTETWPTALTDAVLGSYMQSWPTDPVNGNWTDAGIYNATSGVIDMAAACD
ncbi:MAG: prepilin-type N-terminal cleavage/methylation domain-containing protein [Candidatus Omnitrophota bacterium]|nr:prepilin-type N-terminal cleavage/methylation domain-containing protein [Candidatus Omnitrophota bacterium]MBU1929486.1 prepilin-type N-terminal cleavage/methylation domain-containing protein [Candidatus Omnitrophota bacterium]MBU2034947.1 prepilin-type N-terminal cleavage/methylation domain-containing protein [Candidatus Omnitrophota bacterium]MBU2221708.1 prepilin-type N-terminal cleavage/methylation domain-containing protein [Candidatus Omnitrophota bacterium]MBU2258890.1 prepilin-type N-